MKPSRLLVLNHLFEKKMLTYNLINPRGPEEMRNYLSKSSLKSGVDYTFKGNVIKVISRKALNTKSFISKLDGVT